MKEISWNRLICARECLAVEDQGLLELAGFQGIAREPELGSPASRQRGNFAERVIARRFATALALKRIIPSHAVVLVWINLQRVPERAFGEGLVGFAGISLGQVRQQH